MKYSLIVSIYNIERYLPQCIDSILAQTYSDFEVILVDDGSLDECPRICNEYAKKDIRIKVIHKANGGLMSTRKAGVAVASGDYVGFIDGDDFIAEDMLETFEVALKREDADILCTGYTAYYSGGRSFQGKQLIPCGNYDKNALCEKVYPKMLSTAPFFTFYLFPSVCLKCFRKEIAKKVYGSMPEDISLGEDAAATYPALLLAESVCVLDYHGYMYRQNPDSMTHTYDKGLYHKIRNLLMHLRKVQKELNWDAGRQIDEYSVFLLYMAKNNELIYNTKDKYCVKKKSLLKYLKDDLFRAAIKTVKMKSIRDKIILACFKYRLVFPLYLLSGKNL